MKSESEILSFVTNFGTIVYRLVYIFHSLSKNERISQNESNHFSNVIVKVVLSFGLNSQSDVLPPILPFLFLEVLHVLV